VLSQAISRAQGRRSIIAGVTLGHGLHGVGQWGQCLVPDVGRAEIESASLTDTSMHNMDFERRVLAVDAMLRRGMNVELSDRELASSKGGGAIHDHFDGGV